MPRAIAWFMRQDHRNAELIVVDDGDDAVGDLVPADPRVRYVRLDRRHSVGRKRNLACEAARGEFVMHWDDDDWYAPNRISRQLEALGDGIDVCGASAIHFYDITAARAWLYSYPPQAQRWVYGATLAYRRSFWATHPFNDIDVGEDAYFVWRARPERVAVLDAPFYVGTIHATNVSPKHTRGPYWQPFPLEAVEARLGADLPSFAVPGTEAAVTRAASALRNVYACLVHEQPSCVEDLVRNLRHCDPDSQVLLYDGSPSGRLLADRAAFERLGAVVYPSPRPMRWGYLQDFAFDAMRFALDSLGAGTMTVVDSDQLAVRAGYTEHLASFLAGRAGVGLLGTSDEVQRRTTRIPPAITAWREFERWRPLLRSFAGGEEQFVRWTFWPSTVFTADAMRDLVELRATSSALSDLLSNTSMWAVEEILFPTLVALLGHGVARNPCSPELVRYKVPCTPDELRRAFEDTSIFWLHPVPRNAADPTRTLVRERLAGYGDGDGAGAPARVAVAAVPPDAASEPPEAESEPHDARARPLRALPILAAMRTVEGWLGDDEADALIGLAADAIRARPAACIVEVGSYKGRGTVVLASVASVLDRTARVYAIDPHDGRIGTADAPVRVNGSAQAFERSITRWGVRDVVVAIRSTAAALAWEEPVDLLVVDGLHDYASVAADFARFQPWLREGARIAFHDYAAYFPGVCAFVDELRASGAFRMVEIVGTLAILEPRAQKQE